MLMAEARVGTERSSRYLIQLCRHLRKVAREHPRMQVHVECTGDRGEIDFGWGRCILRADQGVLTVGAEAPDEHALRQLEQRVADRLERFGRREELTVIWTPPRAAAGQPAVSAAGAPHHGGPAHG